MKAAMKWMLASVLLVLALGALWLRDEPLDWQAQQWLDQAQQQHHGESQAYWQLLGLTAPAEVSAERFGRERHAAYQQWRATHLAGQEMPVEQGPLALPPEALCPLGSFACLAQLRSQPEQRSAWLQEHRLLRERYLQLLSLSDYRSVSEPGLHEPLPNFGALERANRLLALETLQLAEQGLPEQALALHEQKIRQLRRLLQQADSLIMKMVVVRLLSHDLDTLALLHQAGLITQPQAQPALSSAERSFSAPMRHEFVVMADTFLTLPADAAQAQDESAWQLRWLYKPQMTVNDQVAKFSEVAQAELDDLLAVQPAPAELSRWRRLRNPIGAILGAIAGPDYRIYLRQVRDLDSKIVLFNQLSEAQPQQAEWDAEQQRYCAQGAWPDERQLRCLPWAAPRDQSSSASRSL